MAIDASQNLKDKFALRRDVMILRQVIYKALIDVKTHSLMGNGSKFEGEEASKYITLTNEEKKFIDKQVVWFFSEMPPEILELYRKEFSLDQPKKVNKTDLDSSETLY